MIAIWRIVSPSCVSLEYIFTTVLVFWPTWYSLPHIQVVDVWRVYVLCFDFWGIRAIRLLWVCSHGALLILTFSSSLSSLMSSLASCNRNFLVNRLALNDFLKDLLFSENTNVIELKYCTTWQHYSSEANDTACVSTDRRDLPSSIVSSLVWYCMHTVTYDTQLIWFAKNRKIAMTYVYK